MEKTEQEQIFCTKLASSYENLSITIEEFGELAFPISDKTAKELVKVAKPVRFGRKKAVGGCNGWKIPKSYVKIAYGEWKKTLLPHVQKMKRRLGIAEEIKLKPKLYDMQIHEKDTCFSPPRDSKRDDDIVAYLVILLPSDFHGGSLVIDHKDGQRIFQRPNNPTRDLTYIAFHADSHYEVEKIKSGYRIALTYHLVAKS